MNTAEAFNPDARSLEFDYRLFDEADRFKGDKALYVRFFPGVLPDDEESKKLGIRKFRDASFVEIRVPGDKRNIVIREVREDDKARFKDQWAAFKSDQDIQVSGFPIKEWSLVTRAMVEELRYLGFQTVEQIVLASDAIAGKYPGFRELQNRAKTWLEAQASSAPLERMQNELQQRDDQLAAMQTQINQLLASAQPATKAK